MRALLVTHGFPPAASGGAELYAETHACALAQTGDHVLVMSRESDSARRDFDVRRERRDVYEIAWVNNTFAAVRSFSDTYTDERVDRAAARLIDEFAPDIAHVHHLTCLSTGIVHLLRSRGIPVFVTLHDYWLLCHRGQLLDIHYQSCPGPGLDGCASCLGPAASAPAAAYAGRSALAAATQPLPAALGARILRSAARIAQTAAPSDAGRRAAAARWVHMRSVLDAVTHFFAPSQYLCDRFVAAGVDAGRISVSEYGWALPVGGHALPPEPATARRSRPLRFGFIGSLMVSKAPHLLIEASAQLPAAACEVHIWGDHADYHGDAHYRARLAPLLRDPQVVSHGKLSRERLQEALAGIDALVVPSIWPENSPLVIREAFLAGVPVVASNIGGIPETVRDGVNGLLFEAGSIAGLCHALQRLIGERGLLDRLRDSLPPVRTVDDDVSGLRSQYETALASRAPKRRLAAVVLNYRTPDDTFLAVRSLLLSRRKIDRIIVVDNDTRAICREVLEPVLDSIAYVRTGRNLGFSAGMNIGIRAALDAGADGVLLVNSDAVVAVDGVGALEAALDTMPGAGIAGPIALKRSAPDRMSALGMSYDLTTGRMRLQGFDTAVGSEPGRPAVVDGVTGCFMLVSRQVFETIGLLDESYFFSFEDLDFCLRARQAAFSTVVAPDAIVLHEGSRSIGADSPDRLYYAARNHLRLARRMGGRGGPVAAAARAAFIVALNFAHALRSPGRSTPARLFAVASGTRDYWLGRFGEAG